MRRGTVSMEIAIATAGVVAVIVGGVGGYRLKKHLVEKLKHDLRNQDSYFACYEVFYHHAAWIMKAADLTSFKVLPIQALRKRLASALQEPRAPWRHLKATRSIYANVIDRCHAHAAEMLPHLMKDMTAVLRDLKDKIPKDVSPHTATGLRAQQWRDRYRNLNENSIGLTAQIDDRRQRFANRLPSLLALRYAPVYTEVLRARKMMEELWRLKVEVEAKPLDAEQPPKG